MYQGQKSDCSLRFAPVSPEQGMKWMSFLGLKPTFFKNGTSFSLHSSYLSQWQEHFSNNLLLLTMFPRTETCLNCKLVLGRHVMSESFDKEKGQVMLFLVLRSYTAARKYRPRSQRHSIGNNKPRVITTKDPTTVQSEFTRAELLV